MRFRKGRSTGDAAGPHLGVNIGDEAVDLYTVLLGGDLGVALPEGTKIKNRPRVRPSPEAGQLTAFRQGPFRRSAHQNQLETVNWSFS